MVERVKQEVGGCDVLINNAGIYHYTDPSEEQRREMLEVNWRGTLRVCLILFHWGFSFSCSLCV